MWLRSGRCSMFFRELFCPFSYVKQNVRARKLQFVMEQQPVIAQGPFEHLQALRGSRTNVVTVTA